MAQYRIPFSKTPLFQKLINDYIADDVEVNKFYSFSPSLAGSQKALEARKQKPIDRKLLVKALQKQYAHIDLASSPKVKANIAQLSQDNTFTVTTGHQLNLLGGHKYFAYKIVDTIKLAERLNQLPGDAQVVPVFWMASEDHDFAEVQTVIHHGKTYTWEHQEGGPVGRMSPQHILPIITRLQQELGNLPEVQGLVDELKKAHSLPTASQALRHWVHHLFAPHGLVIIDGDDTQLKGAFSGVMQQELEKEAVHAAVSQTNAQLQKQQYHLQVHVRNINLFYLQNDARERIVRDGKHWLLGGERVDRAQLLDELQTHPERFSPNALMRPMYQECVLPNICYIGGSGEIAYWLQLKDAFASVELFFPQLMVRNSVIWLGTQSHRHLRKGIIPPQKLVLPLHKLHQYFAENQSGAATIFSALEKQLQSWKDLHAEGLALSQEARILLQMEAAEQQHRIKKVQHDLRKTLKLREEKSLSQLNHIHQEVFPQKIFQERRAGFLEEYAERGNHYIKELLHDFQPFAHEIIVY